jgi:hypothetical protein
MDAKTLHRAAFAALHRAGLDRILDVNVERHATPRSRAIGSEHR